MGQVKSSSEKQSCLTFLGLAQQVQVFRATRTTQCSCTIKKNNGHFHKDAKRTLSTEKWAFKKSRKRHSLRLEGVHPSGTVEFLLLYKNSLMLFNMICPLTIYFECWFKNNENLFYRINWSHHCRPSLIIPQRRASFYGILRALVPRGAFGQVQDFPRKEALVFLLQDWPYKDVPLRCVSVPAQRRRPPQSSHNSANTHNSPNTSELGAGISWSLCFLVSRWTLYASAHWHCTDRWSVLQVLHVVYV